MMESTFLQTFLKASVRKPRLPGPTPENITNLIQPDACYYILLSRIDNADKCMVYSLYRIYSLNYKEVMLK